MRFALTLAALALGGCAQNVIGTVDQMCDSLPPISVSKCDVLSDDTATQIEKDNVAKEVWCGKRQIKHAKSSCSTSQHQSKKA